MARVRQGSNEEQTHAVSCGVGTRLRGAAGDSSGVPQRCRHWGKRNMEISQLIQWYLLGTVVTRSLKKKMSSKSSEDNANYKLGLNCVDTWVSKNPWWFRCFYQTNWIFICCITFHNAYAAPLGFGFAPDGPSGVATHVQRDCSTTSRWDNISCWNVVSQMSVDIYTINL